MEQGDAVGTSGRPWELWGVRPGPWLGGHRASGLGGGSQAA